MKHAFHALWLSMLFCLSVVSLGFASVPPSPPIALPEIVRRSGAVCIARLTGFRKVEPKVLSFDGRELPVGGFLCEPGLYTFDVLRSLKGNATGNLTLEIMQADRVHYNYALFPVKQGNLYLLFLNRGGTRYYPLNERYPFAPLNQAAYQSVSRSLLKTPPGKSDPLKCAEQVLIETLSDPVLFAPNTYLLRETKSPKLVAKVRLHLHDKNPYTVSSVGYCLAFNQVADAIPTVARYSPSALLIYQTREVVRYLNPLVAEPQWGVRFYVMLTLRKFVDKTSLPALVLATQDPNEYGRYYAFVMFRHVLDGKEPDVDTDQFWANEDCYLKPIREWWQEELSGKHLGDAKVLKSSS